MKIRVINQKAFESLESNKTGKDEILGCDGGCSCDTGSDWVNDICPNEWIVGWKKATC